MKTLASISVRAVSSVLTVRPPVRSRVSESEFQIFTYLRSRLIDSTNLVQLSADTDLYIFQGSLDHHSFVVIKDLWGNLPTWLPGG